MTTKTKPQPWTLPNGDECSLDGWHYRAGARYSRCLGVPLCPIQSLHAAAPDLLEVAQQALAWVEYGHPEVKVNDDAAKDHWARMVAWANRARAAIAKAEGGR